MKNLKASISRLFAVSLVLSACGGVDDGSSSDDAPYDGLEDDAPALDSFEAQSLDAESNPDVVEKAHCPIFPIYGCVEYSTQNIAGCMCACNNTLKTLKRAVWSPNVYLCG